MPTTYPVTSSFRQCASCEHWAAPRTIKTGLWRSKIEVPDADLNGECMNDASLFRHQRPPASSGCSNWGQWSALKP